MHRRRCFKQATVFAINQLDMLSDASFYDVVENGRCISLATTEEQRDAMIISHEAWSATLDEDIREGVDWETTARSDWDLYADLRMNGVGFERVGAPAPAM